jgi:molybdopterin molybdotransferase
MLTVAEALARVTADLAPLSSEDVAVAEACGRVLASDLAAKLTQPPFPASAMDGYAVRAADVASLPATLTLIGEAAAGHPFGHPVAAGETVRIFTGAPVPSGADLVVIQENTAADGTRVTVQELNPETFIRPAGGDFREGDVLLRAGRRLRARDLLLAAQMNHATLPVTRRPSVAILASGDELQPPGSTLAEGEIISSIPAALRPMIQKAGAEPVPLGIARDTMESLAASIAKAADADILVTIGGASVGDHDLVRGALGTAGFDIGFHKVAMRPGKPLMYGRRGRQHVLGVPGNPVSAVLCCAIFLRPMICRLLGESELPHPPQKARLAVPLPAGGPRQHYMRAQLIPAENGDIASVAPLPSQDSSLVSILAAADCLIVRPRETPPASVGDLVEIMRLDF